MYKIFGFKHVVREENAIWCSDSIGPPYSKVYWWTLSSHGEWDLPPNTKKTTNGPPKSASDPISVSLMHWRSSPWCIKSCIRFHTQIRNLRTSASSSSVEDGVLWFPLPRITSFLLSWHINPASKCCKKLIFLSLSIFCNYIRFTFWCLIQIPR